MYNDIVTTIGSGNGAMLVLLYLFAAFDTIDHDNLFCIKRISMSTLNIRVLIYYTNYITSTHIL